MNNDSPNGAGLSPGSSQKSNNTKQIPSTSGIPEKFSLGNTGLKT